MIPLDGTDRQPVHVRARVVLDDDVTIGAAMQRSADMRLVLPESDEHQRVDVMSDVERIDD